ncbi:uncharacterized protein FN964_014871 [Alca torda]
MPSKPGFYLEEFWFLSCGPFDKAAKSGCCGRVLSRIASKPTSSVFPLGLQTAATRLLCRILSGSVRAIPQTWLEAMDIQLPGWVPGLTLREMAWALKEQSRKLERENLPSAHQNSSRNSSRNWTKRHMVGISHS